MNKYTLEKFVNLCNDCTYQITENPTDDAYHLALDIQKLYNSYKNDEDIEKVIVYEESNKEFFKCLLAIKDAQGNLITDKYINIIQPIFT